MESQVGSADFIAIALRIACKPVLLTKTEVSCVLQSNVELPYRAIKSNIADSLNLLVHVERRPGLRFVSEVLEIAGYSTDADRYDLRRVFIREEGQ